MKTKREVIVDCYYEGMTREQAKEKSGASYQYTSNLFDELRFEEMRKQSNNFKDRITQIQAIERKLWSLYDDYHDYKAPHKLDKINSLERVYVSFQALNR